LQTRYLNGDGGEHLARTGPTISTAYYLTDRLGSVRELVDLSGAVVYSVSYDAFGNITSQSGSVDLGNLRFAGYWYDGATGLYATHWRWYNPTNGQWTSEDPLGIDAGDANFRRYVRNNGSNSTDITGLREWPVDAKKPLEIMVPLDGTVVAGVKITPRGFEPEKQTMTQIKDNDKVRSNIYTNSIVAWEAPEKFGQGERIENGKKQVQYTQMFAKKTFFFTSSVNDPSSKTEIEKQSSLALVIAGLFKLPGGFFLRAGKTALSEALKGLVKKMKGS
jgi:RHS repeat-associated protein